MAALFYWNINTGSVHLSLERMLTLLRWGNDGTTEGNILWKIRLSRLLGAALLGGALSIAGFLLQTFFKNPIAGPFVLGISSGSRLFVGFFLLAATPIVTGGFSPYVIFLAAFAGALAAMALVLAVSSRVQNLAMLLVIGMMIGYICDAGTDFMITFAESSQLQNFTIWTMGSFSGMTWATLGASALITFVGIAVPHITRLIFRTSRPMVLIPATFLTGSVFCLACDLIARTAFSPTELTISTVTSVLGAPVVIWLMIKRRRNG